MPLKKCDGLWGESHIMYGDPPLRHLERAIFVPFVEETVGNWGLYDTAFSLVKEGQDRRGRQQTPHYDNRWIENTYVEKTHTRDSYLYCGLINFHYGHFIINTLPKFWPYFSKRFKNRKILAPQPADGLPEFIKAIFSQINIGIEDFVYFDRPTELDDVIVPDTCLLEQFFVYELYKDLCEKISSAWLGSLDVNPVPAYLSKARLQRGVGRFVNESVVENIMRASGLDVFYPETMSIVDQVRLFASRPLCAGPIGSAFHSTIFAPRCRKTICYSPIHDINSNFDLIDKVNENEARYFYQEGATFAYNSGGFLTSARLADPDQLAFDLLEEIERHSDWRRRPAARRQPEA